MPSNRFALTAVVSTYLDDCAINLSKHTLESYRWNLHDFVEFLTSAGVISLKRVKPDHIRSFLLQLQKEEYSAGTVFLRFAVLHAFFKWGVYMDLLSINPIDKVRRPACPSPVPVYLSTSEIEKFIDAARHTESPQRDFAVVMVFLDCGLRASELVQLGVEDVDLQGHIVNVRLGKGRKGRRVPMCDSTAHALAEWVVMRGDTDLRLFGMRYGAVYQLIRQLAKQAGINATPHDLRHTFATLYDGDIQDVQRILGHANISTTAQIYRHRDVSMLVKVHEQRSPVAHVKELSQQRRTVGSVLSATRVKDNDDEQI